MVKEIVDAVAALVVVLDSNVTGGLLLLALGGIAVLGILCARAAMQIAMQINM